MHSHKYSAACRTSKPAFFHVDVKTQLHKNQMQGVTEAAQLRMSLLQSRIHGWLLFVEHSTAALCASQLILVYFALNGSILWSTFDKQSQSFLGELLAVDMLVGVPQVSASSCELFPFRPPATNLSQRLKLKSQTQKPSMRCTAVHGKSTHTRDHFIYSKHVHACSSTVLLVSACKNP